MDVSILKAILVSTVSTALQLGSRQSVNTKGEQHEVKDQCWNRTELDSKGLFGNFTLSIPFLHKLVLFDTVSSRESSHPASIDREIPVE